MEEIPRWAVASASLAPVVLFGGWSLAAQLQEPGYDSIRDTISALAGHNASKRWVMTAALACLGSCHIVSACGLRPASPAGRALLASGGVATIFVAGLPLPVEGTSRAHAIAAGSSFLALGAWPIFASRRPSPNPTLRTGISGVVTCMLLGFVAWFVRELRGSRCGLAERVAAGAQAVWPLVVVAVARRMDVRGASTRGDA